MKSAFQNYAARFDALNPRERLLVFLAALAAIGFALHALLIEPALREAAQLRDQLGQQEKVLSSVRSANEALAAARSDPDSTTRARIEQAKKEMAHLTERMGGLAQGLVPPDRMPALLQGLLGSESRLVLVELKTIEPSPLTETPKPPSTEAAAVPDGIFKHGIEMTAQGSYSDLHAYVSMLEKSPFQMYWSGAALDASAYPRIRLTLRFYTVSTDRTWMRL